MVQYDNISDHYVRFKEFDPVKQYVQYPSAIKLLGQIRGKYILDVGCGDGELTRRLAKRAAFVTGYDNSQAQLEKARAQEEKNPLGIGYILAEPKTFKSKRQFDAAVSVMVLPYARNQKELCDFFASTASVLTRKGRFVSIVFNPDFKRFKKIVYYRRWTPATNGTIMVEFFERGEVPFFQATLSHFSQDDYVKAAKQAGFSNITYNPVIISKQGLARVGSAFWKGFLEDCPYVAIIAKI